MIDRRHEMLALINRALKLATGNPNASVHWLRHTFITESAAAVLSSSNLASRNRFGEIGNRAGHASAMTTLTSYTHGYEPSLRWHLDCALDKGIAWSSTSAASLLGVAASTLRKQKQRSDSEDSSLEIIVRDALQKRAQLLQLPSVETSLELKEYSVHPLVWRAPKFSFETLMSILDELSQQSDDNLYLSISLRYQIDKEKVLSIQESAIFLCIQILKRKNHGKYEISNIKSHKNKHYLKHLLLQLKIELNRRHQCKYENIKKYLSNALMKDDDKFSKLTHAWMKSFRGGYISLEHERYFVDIINFLGASKIKYDFLQVKTSLPNQCKDLKSKWFSVFNMTLNPIICKP